MHTYHRLAVEADNEEEAKYTALHFAEEQGWSDWCSIVDNDRVQDMKVATQYTNNPKGFNELIDVACGWTQETVTKAVELYGDIPLREILTNPKYDFGGFNKPLGDLTEEERDTYLNESLAIFKIHIFYVVHVYFFLMAYPPPFRLWLKPLCLEVVVHYHYPLPIRIGFCALPHPFGVGCVFNSVIEHCI